MKTILLLLLPFVSFAQISYSGIFVVDTSTVPENSVVLFMDTSYSSSDIFCNSKTGKIVKRGDVDKVFRFAFSSQWLDHRQQMAAEDVLRYITIEGRIFDRNKFNKAVEHYLDTKTQNENLKLSIH